jgi:4'-phosphopantetheinyl transferase
MTDLQLEVRGVWRASLSAAPPELPPAVVHLWQRSLHDTAAAQDACYELLSPEERDKAARYRMEQPRQDFVLTRGTLRFLLAQYLQVAPDQVSFRYAEHGKPFLAGMSDLRFNVSHSDGLALMAFVRNREIGVDVEKVREQGDEMKLAERFFSVRERNALRSLRGEELHSAFFRCWTRKEAYIKAKGEGLSLPLHQFDVSIESDPAQALLETRPDADEAGRWTLRNVSIHSEYAAALAVEQDAV